MVGIKGRELLRKQLKNLGWSLCVVMVVNKVLRGNVLGYYEDFNEIVIPWPVVFPKPRTSPKDCSGFADE